ncbi:MAG: hypothetical protein IPJ65_05050 [Archangiaceae bacterium]|nr:hypothetical protein [Archangiaceae bacterium]
MNKLALISAVLVVTACGNPLQDFRDAAPSNQGLEVSLPKGDTAKQGLNDETLKPALMPGVTLLATLVVNGGVGLTLGLVAAVVKEEPTVLTEDHAEWGPYTQPLWRHELRLKMERLTEGKYSYVLERRLKGSTAEADYQQVLTGEHHFTGGRSGEGSFVAHDLDHGTRAEVGYSRNGSSDVDVKVGFRGAVPSDYAYTQAHDGDGSFEFIVKSDFVTKSSAQETLTVKSRWHHDGTGRSDVTGTGVDLSSEVRFTECWDAQLNRSYYHDTLAIFPSEGEQTACSFSEESFASIIKP